MLRYGLILLSLVLYDYYKSPIDLLYFNKPLRPFYGIRNTIIDVLAHRPTYDVKDYRGLHLVKKHFKKIRREYDSLSPQLPKTFFHDTDQWFDKNDTYYFYKTSHFPNLHSLLKQIPCVHEESAVVAVMKGPVYIPPHRAETNLQLRYHFTIKSGEDCTLYTTGHAHTHAEGEEFLFDHSRYHELRKTGDDERVVLILDIKRFTP